MEPVSESLVACIAMGSLTAFDSACIRALAFSLIGREDPLLDDWLPGFLAILCLVSRSSVANGGPQSVTVDGTSSSPFVGETHVCAPSVTALCGTIVKILALILCGVLRPNSANFGGDDVGEDL